jgi:hypothetical protein
MHKQGLPYHSNILYSPEGEFTITRAEAEDLEKLGTEVSLHYNFHNTGGPHPRHFTHDEVRQQGAAFRETFGRPPVCTVNHWSLWTGWHHPAVWMAEAGGRGDNSWIPRDAARPNYRFGTGLPYPIYADHTGGNARLGFIAQPVTCYEPLHGEPNRLVEEGDGFSLQEQASVIRRCIDRPAHYGGGINFFIHTYRIADWPASRGAVTFALGYIRERGLTAAHLGNDGLCDWWEGRSASGAVLSDASDGKHLQVTAASPLGVTVSVPISGDADVELPDCRFASRVREQFGRRWLEVAVPEGEHDIRIVGLG